MLIAFVCNWSCKTSIYKDLIDESLLTMCIHGLTQNANESFNAMILERVSKSRFIGYEKIKVGVIDAVGSFNISSKASYKQLS